MFPILQNQCDQLWHVCIVFLCSQSAVVSAPYGRWVEELSRETKRTEEERQVGRKGRRAGMKKGFCLGGRRAAVAQRRHGRRPFHEWKEKMWLRHSRWMENTSMSVSRWSWCVCVAHLRPVWSEETEACFCCFAPLRLLIRAQSNTA